MDPEVLFILYNSIRKKFHIYTQREILFIDYFNPHFLQHSDRRSVTADQFGRKCAVVDLAASAGGASAFHHRAFALIFLRKRPDGLVSPVHERRIVVPLLVNNPPADNLHRGSRRRQSAQNLGTHCNQVM